MSKSASGHGAPGIRTWLWAGLALIVAAVFIRAALQKLLGQPAALEPFQEFGLPPWTVYLTAVAEIAGSIALIVPRTRLHGGLLLAAVMIGAGVTNVANGHPEFLWLNAALLTCSLLLAWQGRRHAWMPDRFSEARDARAG